MQGTGIILGKRLGKVGGGGAGAGARAGDPSSVRELVQKLCQSSTPLAKSMDYLQASRPRCVNNRFGVCLPYLCLLCD